MQVKSLQSKVLSTSKSDRINTCFLFDGFSRSDLLERWKGGSAPDTFFWGANHLFGDDLVDVHILDVEPVISTNFFKKFFFLYKIANKLSAYDVIVSSIGINYFILQLVLFKRRPRWILLNIDLVNVIQRKKRLSLKRFILCWALQRIDFIFCLSLHQLDFLNKQGVRLERMSLLNFGVDYDFFNRDNKEINDEPKYLLSIGRDRGRDNVTLVEAARLVSAQFKLITSRRNMYLVGELPDNVSVEYDVPYERIRNLYRSADAVLVISEPDSALSGSDCSGQVTILDAFASGKPVIATEKSWMHDYFANKEIIMVEPKSPEKLAEKISRFLENKAIDIKKGQAGREKVKSSYNTKNMADAIKQKISDIVINHHD